MTQPASFELDIQKWPDGSNDIYVNEADFGRIAHMASEAAGKGMVAYLTKEHEGGRVAQGTCSDGAPCDRERIHDLRVYQQKSPGRALVLCSHHRDEIEASARAFAGA